MDISYYINNKKKYMYKYAKQPWYAIYSHTTGWVLYVTKRLMRTFLADKYTLPEVASADCVYEFQFNI